MRVVLALVVACCAGAAQFEFRNTGAQVRYAGSKACAACHRAIYDSYTRTGMGRSVTRPDAASVSDPVTIHSPLTNRDFRVYRDGDSLFQTESEQKDGKPVFEATYQLEYAIGSGQNGISFAVRRGDHLFQAPLSFYSGPRVWDLSPGFESTGEGFNRPIHEACIVCHSGRPQAVPLRDGLYRDPPLAELAIGCENCHGPGALHIAERGKGLKTGVPDTSIVNPARLDARLAEDICMQCHQAGSTRVLLPGKRYSDFRPGTPLVRTMAIVQAASEAKDTDLLQHHASMKLSACYRASGGKLSCLTCHNPHEQPGAATAPSYFRARCLTCHTEKSCNANIAARVTTSPPDNCIGCHMPRRSVDRISHSALTNHRIPARPEAPVKRAPPEPASTALRGVVLLNARKGEPPLPVVTRLAAYGELMAKDPGLAQPYFAVLEEARRSAGEDPLVLAALGRKALAEGGADAVALLERAEQKGAAGSATRIDLGQALARAGRIGDSAAALERAAADYPYSMEIRKHLILTYIQQKAYPKAKTALEAYVRDFPEDAFMRGLLNQVSR